ncbi:MAG TPA: DUF2065 domain-containing protein [Gammaproteobacteria bacterium]
MWTDLLAALALVMVIEGLLPALSPRSYRKAMLSMSSMDERSLRITGLVSMVAGAVFLYLIKN